MRPPPWLLTGLKITLAAALIAWMVSSGRLNPGQVAGAARRWPELLGIGGIFYLQIVILAGRWKLLLQAQQVRLSFTQAISLTMIGLLFNLVMPGSVGGDVIKGYYVSSHTVERKPQAMTTILVDRSIGLLGLLGMAACAAFWNLSLFREHKALVALGVTTSAAFLAGVLLLLAAVAASSRAIALVQRLPRRIPLRDLASKSLGALMEYQRRPSHLFAAQAISVLVHLLACFAFYLSTRALGVSHPPLAYFFFIVPLGLVTTILPISPGGIGVGQAAFHALFQLVPGGSASVGADAFTVFQFILILVYLTGFWFYLSYKRAASNRP